MSKHSTRKTSPEARLETLRRRAVRHHKQSWK